MQECAACASNTKHYYEKILKRKDGKGTKKTQQITSEDTERVMMESCREEGHKRERRSGGVEGTDSHQIPTGRILSHIWLQYTGSQPLFPVLTHMQAHTGRQAP